LRHAKRESETFPELFTADVHVGDAATASALHASAGKYNILHLISHYELNKTTPLFSRLFLAPDKDGKRTLELHEVYGLGLKGVDLVVLSVCQSNSGDHSRGDDITGLSRAFMSAGAPTVIASLWKVDDQATSELMASFYKCLGKGESKAEALSHAQAETRAKYPHPFFWAGFVLTGHPGITTAPNSIQAVETLGAMASGTFKK
jgi:CHAT domain-containing protein